MNRSIKTWSVGLGLLVACAGCTPKQQQNAANTAEKSLDRAGNTATKGLNTLQKTGTNVGITGIIRGRIYATKGMHAETIDVTTKNGVVTLSGKVPTAYQKNLAGQYAKAAPGVKSVVNKLKVGK